MQYGQELYVLWFFSLYAYLYSGFLKVLWKLQSIQRHVVPSLPLRTKFITLCIRALGRSRRRRGGNIKINMLRTEFIYFGTGSRIGFLWTEPSCFKQMGKFLTSLAVNYLLFVDSLPFSQLASNVVPDLIYSKLSANSAGIPMPSNGRCFVVCFAAVA
jgi:hypothetical protein